MTGSRADALAHLDVFVGEWVMEARFPGDQPLPSSAGTFSDDGNVIGGAWEKGVHGSGWEQDFALIYRRVG